MSKKLKTPLLDSMEPKPEQSENVKAAYLAYHDDVIDGDLILSPECERGYVMGFLSGIIHGLKSGNKIHEEVYAPTIDRYTNYDDDNYYNNVVPNMKCGKCGESTKSKPLEGVPETVIVPKYDPNLVI